MGSNRTMLYDIHAIAVTNRRRSADEAKVSQIAGSIQQLGLLNPITIAPDGTLIAGLHRLSACKLLGWTQIPTTVIELDALHSELAEIDENLIRNELTELLENMQLARRKEIYEILHPETRQHVAGAKASNVTQGKSDATDIMSVVSFALDTATKTGVDERTIRRKTKIGTELANVAEQLIGTPVEDSQKDLLAIAAMEPEEQQAIVSHIATGRAKNVKQAKQQQRADEATALQVVFADTPPDDRYRLICSAIGDLAIGDAQVDCIITDPPYPESYLPVYDELARYAATVLKPGGSLIVMVGQSYLPDILARMTPHIRYHWTMAYLTPGGQAVQLWKRNVNTFWKPVLWFVKGGYTGPWIGDVTRSDVNHNDKRFHEWGQSESGMADIIERFSRPNDLILDPFCGGGTTGVVALAQGRRFIGADQDSAAIETTRTRLEAMVCPMSP